MKKTVKGDGMWKFAFEFENESADQGYIEIKPESIGRRIDFAEAAEGTFNFKYGSIQLSSPNNEYRNVGVEGYIEITDNGDGTVTIKTKAPYGPALRNLAIPFAAIVPKALVEADGDFDKAIEWLREKGLAAQTKKAGKVAAEGVSLAITADNGVGVLIEVNSQTDFVAKNDVFQGFVKDVANVVAAEDPADVEALKNCTYPGTDRTIADVTADKVLAIGENIQIRRFVRYGGGVNVPYVHMNGKVGVLVNLEVEGIDADKVVELGKDVAMQICAMNPTYLDKSNVSQEVLDKEKEIQLAIMANDPKMAAKPDKVKEGIVMGKLGKYYEENCLLQQAFVKENKISVEKHVAAVAKELGGKITVKAFTRFATGEGIEKAEDDFAAEVASMIK